MCGIAGFWQKNDFFNLSHLKMMAEALKHRGPDYTGFFQDKNIGLVHNRLSIIDLNSRSNQPIHSHDGRFIMAYNGEVYNFMELARQFRIETKTSSDSEVVLELFVLKGVEFVNFLNGMFAIAIYDTVENRLFLFRDRVGIKPLFYFEDENQFVFASELKALQKALPKAWLNLNFSAISNYLHLGFIQAPYSIYKNIFKLLPGELAIVDNKGVVKRKWWSINQKLEKDVVSNETNALVRLDKIVNSAVQNRLISDVPVGTFLSGGIDSSLISAIAARHFPGKIKTFTIGFEHTKHNEADFAKKVANHIGSEHRLLYTTEKEARELLPDIISQYDEPFADTSAIPTMLVSRMAKEEVTVTLSGDGGDELFMGYGSHIWAQRLTKPSVRLLSPAYKQLLKLGNSRHRRAASLFEQNLANPEHIFSQEQYFFYQAELKKLLGSNFNDLKLTTGELNRKLSAAEQQALFDFTYYLPDDLLTKVDRASMRYALETRVPLLDHRIVELAFNLHPSLRLRGINGKYLLKKLLYKYVPEAIFDRPKQGFSVPLTQWMNGPLKDWFEEFLDDQMVKKHGIVDHNYVNKIKNKYKSPRNAYLYNRLWSIAALHAWLDRHYQ